MRRFDAAILTVLSAVLVAGLVVISWQTVSSAQLVLLPSVERKATVSANAIASLSSDAVSYGIPVDRFVRADAVLQNALDENRQFAMAAIVEADGTLVALASRRTMGGLEEAEARGDSLISADIEGPDGVVGRVLIAVPNAVAETLIRDLWVDVAVLLVVAVLVALELTAFAFALPATRRLRALTTRMSAIRRGDFRVHENVVGAGRVVSQIRAMDQRLAEIHARHRALGERAAQAMDTNASAALDALAVRYGVNGRSEAQPAALVAVRAPVFLFFFAEEMMRPFLPNLIARFAVPVPGLSPELVIALPIVLFMAIVALSQPWLNGVTERVGRATSLKAGALVAAAGFFATAFAGDLWQLTAARALTAVGFAVVFVAAQGFIVDRTAAGQRARGIGLFVSAIMAAMLCGPPIGGIIANRLGDSTAILFSAGMACAAFLCAWIALPQDRSTPTTATRSVQLSDLSLVLRRPLMAALLIGCAMPAKILLIGICFYFLPLELALQFEPALIGRVLMLYGLAMLIVVPAVSRWSDSASHRVPFVVLGSALAGLSVVHLYLWPEPWGAALLVLQIGIAQGLSTTPQSALVGEIGRRLMPDLSEGGIYGVFRLVERLGTAIGPLFVGAVWTAVSPTAAIWATGGLVVTGAFVFLLAWLLSADRQPVAPALKDAA